jgi:hypothetical protein
MGVRHGGAPHGLQSNSIMAGSRSTQRFVQTHTDLQFVWVGNNARETWGLVSDSTGAAKGTLEDSQVVFHEDEVCMRNVGPSY